MSDYDSFHADIRTALSEDDPLALEKVVQAIIAERARLAQLEDVARAFATCYVSKAMSDIGAPTRQSMQKLDAAIAAEKGPEAGLQP